MYGSEAIGIGTATLRIGEVAANRARRKGEGWYTLAVCEPIDDRGWGEGNGRRFELESQCQLQ